MTSYWKRIAQELEAGNNTVGSHKRRAAAALEAENEAGTSWPARIANKVGREQSIGSHTRRMTPLNAPDGRAWAGKARPRLEDQ